MAFNEPEPIYSSFSYPIVVGGLEQPLNIPAELPGEEFSAILSRRRSTRALGGITVEEISGVLWESCRVLETGFDSWGRPWTHAVVPSAGGVFACRVIVDREIEPPWLYDPYKHAAIHRSLPLCEAFLTRLRSQRRSILSGSSAPTLYIVGNLRAIQARYTDPWTLLLRDSGALAATIQFNATRFGLGSCILGFHGTDIISAFGLGSEEWVALGGLSIGKVLSESR